MKGREERILVEGKKKKKENETNIESTITHALLANLFALWDLEEKLDRKTFRYSSSNGFGLEIPWLFYKVQKQQHSN